MSQDDLPASGEEKPEAEFSDRTRSEWYASG